MFTEAAALNVILIFTLVTRNVCATDKIRDDKETHQEID